MQNLHLPFVLSTIAPGPARPPVEPRNLKTTKQPLAPSALFALTISLVLARPVDLASYKSKVSICSFVNTYLWILGGVGAMATTKTVVVVMSCGLLLCC